jgi:hypothetical protein
VKFRSPSSFFLASAQRRHGEPPRMHHRECIKFFIEERWSSIFFICSHSLYIAAKKKAVAPTKRTYRETGGKLILIDEAQYHQRAWSIRGLLLLLQGVRCGAAAAKRDATRSLSAPSHCVMTCSSRSSYFIYY